MFCESGIKGVFDSRWRPMGKTLFGYCLAMILLLVPGLGVAKKVTLKFTIAEATVTKFSFKENADTHYVADDNGKVNTGGWIQNRRPQPQWPTAITRKTKPEVWVVLRVLPKADEITKCLTVRGIGSKGGVTFSSTSKGAFKSVGGPFGGAKRSTLVSAKYTSELEATVSHFPKATTQLEVSCDGFTTPPIKAGTVVTPIYTTWKRKGKSTNSDLTSKMYETLLYASTKGFEGKKLPTSEYDAMIMAYDDFLDLDVRSYSEWSKNEKKLGKIPLKYWGGEATNDPGIPGSWVFYAWGLLEKGDGRCEAWARALGNAFWQQGIQNFSLGPIIIKNNYKGRGPGLQFFVKNWVWSAIPIPGAPYPFSKVPGKITSIPGIPGQGRVKALGRALDATPGKKNWPSHAILLARPPENKCAIFDPSYGTLTEELASPSKVCTLNESNKVLKEHEDKAIDFYTYDSWGPVNGVFKNDTTSTSDSEMEIYKDRFNSY